MNFPFLLNLGFKNKNGRSYKTIDAEFVFESFLKHAHDFHLHPSDIFLRKKKGRCREQNKIMPDEYFKKTHTHTHTITHVRTITLTNTYTYICNYSGSLSFDVNDF